MAKIDPTLVKAPLDLRGGEGVDTGRFRPAATPLTAQELARMRRDRLAKLRRELARRELAGIVLFDPINIRYACDVTNMQVWVLHNAARYLFVATEGPAVLFDFHRCEHLAEGVETLDEVRGGTPFFYFNSGPRVREHARKWAAEIADLARAAGGRAPRIALDRAEMIGVVALEAQGVMVDPAGQDVLEVAREIKTPEEIKAMRVAMATAEAGCRAMHSVLRPGMTENELWSVLHQVNIAHGGEWIETRLLASGARANPWYRECGDHPLGDGDFVAFDTDLIGNYGYCADISRTWLIGGGKPSGEQATHFDLATEQIAHNTALLKPGLSFRDFTERAWPIPEAYHPNRYTTSIHGIGLCDEYPMLTDLADWDAAGFDGVFLPGMTVCVESYIGRVGGSVGVKLEEQVLITETGSETLSTLGLDPRAV